MGTITQLYGRTDQPKHNVFKRRKRGKDLSRSWPQGLYLLHNKIF